MLCELPRATFSKMLRGGFPAGCAAAAKELPLEGSSRTLSAFSGGGVLTIGGGASVFSGAESEVPDLLVGGVGGVGFAAVFDAAIPSRISVVAAL